MLKSKTAFVLGAGTSFEVGLPTGLGLANEISGLLNLRFPNGHDLSDGDRLIFDAMRMYSAKSQQPPDYINKLIHAGWAIREAMPLAKSIDNFVDAHREDAAIELSSKLSIARAILLAEGRTLLKFDEKARKPILASEQIRKTWLPSMFKLLNEGVSRVDMGSIFDNVVFIVFNYDRCLEHYLYYALIEYYRLTEIESQDIMKNLKIVHPYGTVGALSWQDGSTVSYGCNPSPTELLQSACGIRTFTEGFSDTQNSPNSISALIAACERIVFLGSAFHSINMKFFTSEKKDKAYQIIGTGYKISDDSIGILENQLRANFRGPTSVKINNRFTCSDFFDHYEFRLRSSA